MKLNINLKKEIDNSYNVIFSENVGVYLSDFLLKNNKNKILIVSDSNVFPIYYEKISSCMDSKIKVNGFEIKAGEKNKNIKTVLDITKELIKLNFNRGDILVALGGGVVGDIVGMTASLYKRGIDFIQIPTSLLSMFDSSVGGKTGVDFEGIKNIIGVFKQPKLVLINVDFLKTLPEKEFLSGYFEGLKHSLIKDIKYFNDFTKINNFTNLEIKKNVSIKAEIVMQDEFEKNIRKFLNYGHTFGHALESITNFKLTHGVCVGYGMLFANILSNKLGYLSNKDLEIINNYILEKLKNQKIVNNLFFDDIYKKMLSDKKNTDENISFILLEEVGKLLIVKIGKQKINILKSSFDEFLRKIG